MLWENLAFSGWVVQGCNTSDLLVSCRESAERDSAPTVNPSIYMLLEVGRLCAKPVIPLGYDFGKYN
jgi:hypothetical protein